MNLKFPKVLLIDDDKPFGEALCRWLSELGYQPSVATTAAQGVALLEQGDFEAILLDLQLPDVSGHAIIRQLKNLGVATPVIVVSGTTEMDDVVRAWRENAADFLRKPFRIEDLSTALDKALRRGPEANAAAARPASGTTSPAGAPSAPARAPVVAASPGQPGRLRPAVAKLVDRFKSGAIRLPILDPRVLRLPEFLTTENWQIEELADVVTRDSNLAAGILRQANSSAYSRGRELTSVRDACTRLGSKAIVAIAFEITVRGQFTLPQEPGKTALKNCWRNAVVASRVAPLLGEMLRLPDREHLRLPTLFHNIGELLSICLLADSDDSVGGAPTLAQLALEVGAIHEDIGAALATSWQLPSSVIRLAGCHHRASREPEPKEEKLLRHLVLASWAIALRAGFTYFPHHTGFEPGALLHPLGLSEEKVAPLYAKLRTWYVDA